LWLQAFGNSVAARRGDQTIYLWGHNSQGGLGTGQAWQPPGVVVGPEGAAK